MKKEESKKKELEIAYDMRKLAGTTVAATMNSTGERVLVDISSKKSFPYYPTFLRGGWQNVNKSKFQIDWNINPK